MTLLLGFGGSPQISIAELVQGFALDDYVELFELDATNIGGDVYRFTKSAFADAPIEFDGEIYSPIPVEAEGWELNGRGPIPQPTLRVSNVGPAFAAAVIAFKDLLGATVTRKRTFKRFLDGQPDADPDAVFPVDVYTVDQKIAHDKEQIEWRLASVMDQQGLYLPGRVVLRGACLQRYRRYDSDSASFDYSKATCPYAGSSYFTEAGAVTTNPALDRCGKKLSDCKKRFGNAPLPTWAFPGVDRMPTN